MTNNTVSPSNPHYSDIGTRLAAVTATLDQRKNNQVIHSKGNHTDDNLLPPFPTIGSRVFATTKLALAKRESEKIWHEFEKENGPRAEYHTATLYGKSTLIPVNRIIANPKFENTHLHIDPAGLDDLQASIDLEGLKVPIIVIEDVTPGYYHVCAGFRRTQAVKNLKWTEIPATILPADTPSSEEYWVNIVENTSREKLSTYELAMAARKMRDQFGITIAEFARKTSHSPSHISELLGCLERLPGEVLQSWENNDRVPFSIYVKLSMMTHLEAIKNLRLWKGQHRIDSTAILAEKALDKRKERQQASEKDLTVRGIEKTQRLMIAVRVSKLPQETKQVVLEVIEYIQGCRKRIEGVIHDGWRAKPQPSTEDQDFELMMQAKIQELERQNSEEPVARRNDEDDR